MALSSSRDHFVYVAITWDSIGIEVIILLMRRTHYAVRSAISATAGLLL